MHEERVFETEEKMLGFMLGLSYVLEHQGRLGDADLHGHRREDGQWVLYIWWREANPRIVP